MKSKIETDVSGQWRSQGPRRQDTQGRREWRRDPDRHSLRAIDQHIRSKAKAKGFDSIDTARSSIRITALPQYLHFLSDESDWILSKGQTRMCAAEHARTLRAMIKRHLLRHPLLPKVVDDNADAPQGLIYQTYEEIHASAIKEMLDYCRSIEKPKLFRYFWNNWYRPEFGNVGSRWEIASLCGRRDSDATIPISRTTMRLESHWRILKKDYASRFIKPKLDVLCYIVFTGLVLSRIHLHLQVEAGREKPRVYKDFVHVWRKCAGTIDNSAIVKRDEIYYTDKSRWVGSCPSFILNSRYKHLVSYYSSAHPDGIGRYIVQPPPPFTPELFQERLPLIRFNDSDLVGTVTVSSGVELSDCVVDDARSSTYADELASFDLLPCENPEATEENDEESMELLRILHWASGEQCESNPRMQRDVCRFISDPTAFIARFKRPYEEALGTARSGPSHTMRKAPKSYFYMRPQNQSQRME